MWKIIFAILFYLGSVFTEKSRVCYYRNKSYKGKGEARFTPEDVDPFLCTEINYAFLKINMGTYEIDTTMTEDVAVIARLNALKKVNPSLKVTIAIGGWNHEKKPRFSNMVHTKETRMKFINSVVAFLKKHNLDGVSLDWMYPGTRPKNTPASDKFCFTKLLKECAAAFKKEFEKNKKRFSLTASVAANKNKINAGYQVKGLAMYLDRVDVMAYSLWGPWKKERTTGSPTAMEGNTPTVTNVIKLWLAAGMPANKINLGITSFGRSFKLENPMNHGLGAPFTGPGRAGPYINSKGGMTYYEICSINWDKKTEWKDSMSLTPYASKKDLWVGYDDEKSIRYKVEHIVKSMDLNGITFWALDWDDFSGKWCKNGKFPLLTEAAQALKPPVADGCTKNPCQNGGECSVTKNSFKCNCKEGFSGSTCELKDYCANSPCFNNATCINKKGGFECQCVKQFRGKLCKYCKEDHDICDMFDDPAYYCSHDWMLTNCARYCGVCKEHEIDDKKDDKDMKGGEMDKDDKKDKNMDGKNNNKDMGGGKDMDGGRNKIDM